MEGRGSLRQLHQQLAGATSYQPAPYAAVPEWQSGYSEKRPPPPLPTLPPWALNPLASATQFPQQREAAHLPSSSMGTREEHDPASTGGGRRSDQESGGWRKAPSYFGTMKRLPLPTNGMMDPVTNQLPQRQPSIGSFNPHKHQYDGDERAQRTVLPPAEPFNQQYVPQKQNQQQETDEEPERVGLISESFPSRNGKSSHDALGDDDPSCGDGARGETNQVEDEEQNHDHSDPLQAKPSTPVLQQGGFFRPWKKTEQNEDEMRDNNYLSDREGEVDSPQVNKWKVRALLNPFARRKAVMKASPSTADSAYLDESSQAPEVQPSLVGPKRPTTPLPGPSSLLSRSTGQQLHYTPLSRSHDDINGEGSAEADNDEKLHCNILENIFSKPRLTPPPFRRKAKAPTPLDTSKQQEGLPRESRNREESEDFQACKAPAKMTKHVVRETNQQHSAAKAVKPKASTLGALAEIQRKRNERRAQQAEEKQRIQSELEEHGDDNGYKFRRLIQKYRDALPAFQKQQKTALPPLAKNDISASAGIPTARLSVFVRKRPLSKKELKAKGYDIISCLYAVAAGQGKSKPSIPVASSCRQELLLHEPKLKVDCSETLENHQFRFDGVFDEMQDNSHVYALSVGPMIPYLIPRRDGDHTNLTVFAYGQTGSGKTYTMKSIYRQAATDLFERIEGCSGDSGAVMVGVSFYEIYMNNVNDLLNGRSRLQLMEDGEGTVQLLGLKEVVISSADELLDLVKHGEDSRATSANAVHDDSSRSHALLRITLYPGEDSTTNSSTILARLSMVDLAGSERACDTQSDNKNTRMEGAEINKSLLALKECIRALDRGAAHIPFRQSKLTQLLRDSFLSQNSKTVMIATVSPWSESCNHTLNTLRYADRLKEIGGQ